MGKAIRKASTILAGIAAAAFAAPGIAAPARAPGGAEMRGGITVLATFNMAPYNYETYRQAVSQEIPIMEKNGLKFVKSYRVVMGEMDKYIDIWWAPDYDTFHRAFYNPSYTDPKFEDFLTRTKNLLQSAKIEVVEEEKF